MKLTKSDAQFINFLQEELHLPPRFIAMALRHCQPDLSPLPLPMILWQYGLVSLEQLEQIFNWLECQPLAQTYHIYSIIDRVGQMHS